ncbi:alpha-soluble NSF attachment protein [Acrasis kona]|uniref:Alpha-soluble NSF attachment protein n=1 Tax=Acrasis kona TaxID=1008807 RepID=A0AAW2ZD09_9EUKA
MASTRSSQEGDELVLKAEKELKSWGVFGKEAGDTLHKTVLCHLKLESRFDAAQSYLDAAQNYLKVSKKDTITSLECAINEFSDMGKLDKVGKIEQQLAELYEDEGSEEGNLEKAIQHYERAEHLYDSENMKSASNTCMQKAAHINAMVGNYEKALGSFEQSARNALDDKLLKYGAKDSFFKAGLCGLCKMDNADEDLPEFKEKFESYKEEDVMFEDSYECKLVDKLIIAIEGKNVKAFQMAIKEYDNIKRLDNWKTQILLKIKDKVGTTDLT